MQKDKRSIWHKARRDPQTAKIARAISIVAEELRGDIDDLDSRLSGQENDDHDGMIADLERRVSNLEESEVFG